MKYFKPVINDKKCSKYPIFCSKTLKLYQKNVFYNLPIVDKQLS